MFKKCTGFTLVEILVVITILTILVTISVITYNGSQLRARNAQTASAVITYKDALVLSKLNNGVYPEPTTAGTRPCLGNSYPFSTCWFSGGTVDTAFMSSLSAVTGGTLPMPAMPNLSLKGIVYSPPSIGHRIDGTSYANATPVAFLTYSVEGTATSCPTSPVASKPANLNVYWWSSTPPVNNQTYAVSGSYPVQCWLPLPYK